MRVERIAWPFLCVLSVFYLVDDLTDWSSCWNFEKADPPGPRVKFDWRVTVTEASEILSWKYTFNQLSMELPSDLDWTDDEPNELRFSNSAGPATKTRELSLDQRTGHRLAVIN